MKYLASFAFILYATTGSSPVAAQPLLTAGRNIPVPQVPPALVLYDTPDMDFAIFNWMETVARYDDARDRAWLDAEREAWLAIERDNLARQTVVARSTARRAPVEITPGSVWSIIDSAAIRWGLDPVRFARVAWCESKGDPNAWNPSGASGPFQQMPQFWAGRAAAAGYPGASIWDLWVNVEVSAWLASTGGWSHWNPSRSCWG